MKEKLRGIIKAYLPIPALILFSFAILCGVIHVVSELSVPFSDFFNRYVSSVFRGGFALITGIVPFSVAECVIILLPVLFVALIASCVRRTNRDLREGIRYVVNLCGIVSLMYSLFVVTTVVAYNGSTLSEKLGLSKEPVSKEELELTSRYMAERINAELDNIDFIYGDRSVMPYSVSEMNDKLMEAYDRACDKYSFIPRLHSRIKQICLSEPMTYTHISGMYTYYTGEANLNINFPDYNLPYTAAHELAHQRGILPENEANFVAFLVCMESDDPYIRYSAYLNIYEYLCSPLRSADYDTFAEVYYTLDMRVRCEMSAYNKFFEKYRDNTAANVSSALNDSYLKAQGQTEGEKSYGMVVDLAVSYVKSLTDTAGEQNN